MPHKDFIHYLPTREQVYGTFQHAYLASAPDSMPCYYCGEPCAKYDECGVPVGHPAHDPYEYLYRCDRHDGLQVLSHCVNHDLSPKYWFFNRIKVIHGKMQLAFHFFNPYYTELRELVPARDRCWGPHWNTVMSLPACTIEQPPKRLLSILKLTRVFA